MYKEIIYCLSFFHFKVVKHVCVLPCYINSSTEPLFVALMAFLSKLFTGNVLQPEKTYFFLAIVLHILVLYRVDLAMGLHKFWCMPCYRDQF